MAGNGTLTLPKDGLVRAFRPGVELRVDTTDDAEGRTLFGHFAVFDRWTEINSLWEGNFLERIAPGAFKRTIREQRDKVRVLLEHGMDPELGNKPIASINDLREDETGAYYEARLFDGLPPLVMDGLRAGQYGASFRFRVIREDINEEPGTSDENPKGLPERSIREVHLMEFGPVTFGAYQEATADVRSLTDELISQRMGVRFANDSERWEQWREFIARLDPETDDSLGDEPEEEQRGTPTAEEVPAPSTTPEPRSTSRSGSKWLTPHESHTERRWL